MPYQTVRKVLPHEYSKYRSHLKLLDTESKVLRFGNAFNDSAIDTICDRFEANADQHILFAIENDQLEFIAVGHIALTDGMELAFSVLKEYQAQGLGNLLMKRCIMYCRTHGILKGCMVCLSTNSVIKHLCRKYGIHIQTEDGETLADIALDHPSLSTYMEEATDNNLGIIDYLSKRINKPWALFA
jgi:GNAT superfamily N-acetyltransferase